MDNKLLPLLFAMKRIREVEMRISKEYSSQKIRCPVHLSVGQEAPSAALSLLIKKDDYSVSTHRGHAHFLSKGGCLNSFIAELYGKKTGCSKGKGGSMHLIDPSVNFMGTSAIVGNSIPTGTGLALAAKLNNKNQISVIHIGDGAIEEGSFYESLNFAVVKKIPALYFCENNFYSVYSSLNARQPKGRSLTSLAKSIGAHSSSSDGNCALECFQRIKEAIKYTREEKKPFFLELKTYRWLEHCGPNFDDHLKYRPESEIKIWKKRDPIAKLENLLNKDNKKEYAEYCDFLDQEINNAFDKAKNDSPPSEEEAYTQIFSN